MKTILIGSLLMLANLGHSVLTDAERAVRESITEKTKQELLMVFEANENLHQKFYEFNKNPADLEKAAAIVTTAEYVTKAIDGISDPIISTKLQLSKQTLAEIGEFPTREGKNKAYNLISMAFIHLINTYDLGSKYNVYYCSMKKKKWVQPSNQMLNNPYASDTMPHCGKRITDY